ncbi:putative integral membrane protein [Actinacidiphila reveromycinica]|uniref:Putative integral membrane protein n=1 Tax=Actinacidiphila reveromycinica TaxID=659352 RepID=A0A7U3UY47_9ACTN|nr:MFS transporter [Streptomyces sp. SN-593]BBB00989.1 putative integral membrane protein [Streptomyces sp. SN-593]
MTTWQPARVAVVRGPRGLLRRVDLRHPVVVATLLAAVLHVLWALYLAKDSGDMAAQYAWTEFIKAHPAASYNLSWYGGMHPASYSILSPYIMAALGVRMTGVIAGTLTATFSAAMLMRARVKRPLVPVLWTTFALWGDVVSGRVTFALGMLFAVVATVVLYPAERAARGRSPRLALATAMAAFATMCSPVAGLFLLVVAAALFLTGRRKDAYILAAAPPLVVGATSLLFPFYGVQPFKWYFAIIPFAVSVAIALAVPKAWKAIHLGSWVYALGVALTFVIPSPIGSNVERLALLYGGTILLVVAMASTWGTKRALVLWLAFAGTASWQIAKPIVDQVTTSATSSSVHASSLIHELGTLHADRGRVEVVPLRSHWEASGLSPYVNLARGWNRQADVERNPLFYDGTLTADTYRDWLRRWSVNYVVLPSVAQPDGAAVAEAKLVAAGQPWMTEVWHDADWQVYSVAGADPMADPPAVVDQAGPAELTVTMPNSGSVLLRIPWSPVLGIEGATDNDSGCLAPDGDWTRLYAPEPGTYKIGGTYALIRGTQCDKAQIQDGTGREPTASSGG